jgi:ectoine hydroxylase-related dioxygenase (phytanoyl-CoA dioxygenase family)
MTEDLSARHAPITSLFPRPATREEWARFRLSDGQVRAYHENGYVAGVRILDDAQVYALRAELVPLMDPAHPLHHLFYEFHSNESTEPDKVLFHALGAWRISAAFHDALWNPRFLAPASQLLGGAVRFWHDQLFCKPARHGGIVAWHQDYSYWTRTQPVAHLSCWIGLDDSTRANGCLHYVPGSHRWPLLPRGALADNMENVQPLLTAEQRAQFQPVAIEMPAGHGAFHHAMLVHGSYANQTPLPRRALVINVFRDGVESASDQPPLAGVPSIPAGHKMDGQFFPLLFTPHPPGRPA